MRRERSRRSVAGRSILYRVGSIGIVVLLLVGLPVANLQLAQQAGLGEQFRPLYLAARTALGGEESPYSREAMAASFERSFGAPPSQSENGGELEFTDPLPATLLAAPLLPLDYPLARAAWLTLLQISQPLLLLAGLGFVRWRPSLLGLVSLLVFVLAWRPGLQAMVLGPTLPVYALALVAGLWLLNAGSDLLAGICLGFSLLSPGLSWLVLLFVYLWAISRSRWLLIGSTTLVGLLPWVGLTIWRPGWLTDWLAAVVTAWRPEGPNTLWLSSTPPWLSLAGSVLLVLYLIWQWISAWGRDSAWFAWTAAMTMVISSILLAPPESIGNILALPGLLLAFRVWSDRWGRTGGLAAGGVAGFLLVVPWLPLVTDLPKPLAQAGSLWLAPVVTLLGLLWSRWWAVQQERLPLA